MSGGESFGYSRNRASLELPDQFFRPARRFAKLCMVIRQPGSDRAQFVRSRHVSPRGNSDGLFGDVKIEPRGGVLLKRPMREDRRDMGLVGSLVGAETRIAVD